MYCKCLLFLECCKVFIEGIRGIKEDMVDIIEIDIIVLMDKFKFESL